MRNRLQMTWRAGMAMVALAGATLIVAAPTAGAQMHTEMHGAPAGGAIGIPGGSYGESGLNTVIVDDGGPGMITSGGYAPPPIGPSCTVEIVGHGGRGVAQNSDPGCGVAGAYGPIGVSGSMAKYP